MTMKDLLSLCRNMVAEGRRFRYNEHGAILDDNDGTVLYYALMRSAYPTSTAITAEAMFEGLLGNNLVRILYNSSYNHFRGASRRDRWMRRLIAAACGLPRWQRPTVEKYRQ